MPYIQSRYAPRRANDIIFVREGTTKRWTLSLRGHLWFLQLKQSILGHADLGCSIRFMKDEVNRIPYAEIAEHRAAIFFPGIGHGKLTIHELRTMGMPALLPSKALLYRV